MKEITSLQNKPENKHPSNLEAEQALLGSIMVNNDIIISPFITPYTFILFIFIQSYILATKFSIAFRTIGSSNLAAL